MALIFMVYVGVMSLSSAFTVIRQSRSLHAGIAALVILCIDTPVLGAVEDHGNVSYTRYTSDNGYFVCSFFGKGTGKPGSGNLDGTYTNRLDSFSQNQMDAIMKAVNTLEKTFVFSDNQIRPARLTFGIGSEAWGVSASTYPDPTFFKYSNLSPRPDGWLESDFNGHGTGNTAKMTNLECVLKYNTDASYTAISPADEWTSSIPGKEDGYVHFSNSIFANGQSEDKYLPSMETVALHELGHLLGFNIIQDAAMDTLVEQDADGVYWFLGETAMKYNGGQKVKMSQEGPVHINADYGTALMNQYPRIVGQTTYSDLDLAIFQDMGWTIQDSAWSNATIPESSTATLLLAGALLAAFRRR